MAFLRPGVISPKLRLRARGRVPARPSQALLRGEKPRSTSHSGSPLLGGFQERSRGQFPFRHSADGNCAAKHAATAAGYPRRSVLARCAVPPCRAPSGSRQPDTLLPGEEGAGEASLRAAPGTAVSLHPVRRSLEVSLASPRGGRGGGRGGGRAPLICGQRSVPWTRSSSLGAGSP